MSPSNSRQIFPGLFNPEAFITATRQCVAQANSWSLEELDLDVCVADEAEKPSFDDCSFAVEGLKLFGAACRNNQLSISAEISTNLHLTRLRWIKKSECESTSCLSFRLIINCISIFSARHSQDCPPSVSEQHQAEPSLHSGPPYQGRPEDPRVPRERSRHHRQHGSKLDLDCTTGFYHSRLALIIFILLPNFDI